MFKYCVIDNEHVLYQNKTAAILRSVTSFLFPKTNKLLKVTEIYIFRKSESWLRFISFYYPRILNKIMELTVAKIRLALTVVFIFSFLFNFEKMHAIALVQKYGIF